MQPHMMSLLLRVVNGFARYYSKLKVKITGSRGRVLVFHEIMGKEDVSCSISPETFYRIIERLRKENHFVHISEILNNGAVNNIAITFDDVPYSFYSEAYPILKEKQIPFTLFVAKKFVGKAGFLSADDIKSLDKDPLCTIGAHTCNHTKLRYEENSYADIKESKDYLEQLLGHPVKYLAYPYGRYDSVSKKNKMEVKAAGFEAAFSTIQTSVPNKFDKYFIPRIELIK